MKAVISKIILVNIRVTYKKELCVRRFTVTVYGMGRKEKHKRENKLNQLYMS
jgi:hypothetical protein